MYDIAFWAIIAILTIFSLKFLNYEDEDENRQKYYDALEDEAWRDLNEKIDSMNRMEKNRRSRLLRKQYRKETMRKL